MYTHPEDDGGLREEVQPRNSRLRQMTVYQTRPGRPRWMLHTQAVFWRVLMGLGMFFHRLAPPRPPKPTLSRQIPSTISSKPGMITLNLYVPKDYDTQRRLWTNRPELDLVDEEEEESSEDTKLKNKRISTISNMGQSIRRRSTSARKWGGYPVVINFHGGGFTLGSSGDDARWCGTVVNECNAVVISVDYRLAPEHPFPTAVEDGVDAVLWTHEHAEELGIDKDKIALSGFSSGGNMAFTVPLRLYDEISGFPRDDVSSPPPTSRQKVERAINGSASPLSVPDSASSSSTRVAPPEPSTSSAVQVLDPNEPPPPLSPPKPTPKAGPVETITERPLPSDLKIRCIISWYPSLDYTRTREQRRATGRRPDQELPALFTDLFDESYLHPPNTISLDSPYLSPGVAPTSLLRNALPQEIILTTCEWDMLLDEGIAFHERLTSPEMGKNVWYKMVEGVPHGWDKAPNPWKPTPGVREHYLRACKEMRRVLGATSERSGRPLLERETTKGFPTAAGRDSINVVR